MNMSRATIAVSRTHTAVVLAAAVLFGPAVASAQGIPNASPGQVSLISDGPDAVVALSGVDLSAFLGARIVDAFGVEVPGSVATLDGTTGTLTLRVPLGVEAGEYAVDLVMRADQTVRLELPVTVESADVPPEILRVGAPALVAPGVPFTVDVMAEDDSGITRLQIRYPSITRKGTMANRILDLKGPTMAQEELSLEGVPAGLNVLEITAHDATGNVSEVYEFEVEAVVTRLVEVSFADSEIHWGGEPTTGTVSLDGPAPSPVIVSLEPSGIGNRRKDDIHLPATVTIRAGRLSADFVVTAAGDHDRDDSLVLTATSTAGDAEGALTLLPVERLEFGLCWIRQGMCRDNLQGIQMGPMAWPHAVRVRLDEAAEGEGVIFQIDCRVVSQVKTDARAVTLSCPFEAEVVDGSITVTIDVDFHVSRTPTETMTATVSVTAPDGGDHQIVLYLHPS